MILPTINDKVAISFRSAIKEKTGEVHYVQTRTTVSPITRVYHDGKVGTPSGDVWEVKEYYQKGARLTAVAVIQ